MNGYLEKSREASQNDTEFILFSSVSGLLNPADITLIS